MDDAWSTAVPDWEDRLLAGRRLVPEGLPLDEEMAAKAVRVFDRLRVPDVEGQPRFGDVGADWFRDIVRILFGSLVGDRRMIQELFLLVPKKNGKSTQAAALMLVAMILNRRPRAEGLFLAPTKEIADISFGQAEGMIEADPELTKLFHPQRHIRRITHRVSGAFLQIKAADTDAITGFKGTYALIDETHVFSSHARAADVFLEVRGALAARPDGFLAQITTQSKTPPAGVFKSELEQARAVRDGRQRLPQLVVLYELPERMQRMPDDGSPPAWTDPATFGLVNPNLGKVVDPDFLVRGVATAREKGKAELALFASQHLNVEIGVGLRSDGWAGQAVWSRGDGGPRTLEELLDRCEVATVGADGGGLDDLFGVGVIGREKRTRRWLLWAHALIGPEGLERRKANASLYRDFERDGDLTVVDGLPADLEWIVERVGLIKDAGLLAMVGADPAGIGGLVDALAEIGVTEEAKLLVGVPQGIRLMNAAKTVERKLADGTLKHCGSRLLAWCVGNAKVRATSTAMLIERAASGFGKIDPLMAAFNAAHLMQFNPEAGASVITGADILTVIR